MEPIILHFSSNGTHTLTQILKANTHNSAIFKKKVLQNNGTSPYPEPIKLPPPVELQHPSWSLISCYNCCTFTADALSKSAARTKYPRQDM